MIIIMSISLASPDIVVIMCMLDSIFSLRIILLCQGQTHQNHNLSQSCKLQPKNLRWTKIREVILVAMVM